MRKLHQRVMAMALACLMVVGLAPVSAMAADGASAEAETYYVADSGNGGSDLNGTGSYDHPYMTISHAIEAAVDDGEDELIISLLSGVEISNELDLSGDSGLSALTINGNGHKIYADGTFVQTVQPNQSGDSAANSLVTVTGKDITLKNITLQTGTKNVHALNLYQAENVVLDNVVLDHTNS